MWIFRMSMRCLQDCVRPDTSIVRPLFAVFLLSIHPRLEGRAMTQSDTNATLSFSDGSPSLELPVYKGTIGPDVIDIRKLYGATGKFTYHPGFM